MSSKELTIGILLPVYNVAEYLEACIESILGQIDSSAMIILMNDASTDNSASILADYKNHSQIQVVEAPYNRGLSATRNELLKLTDAEYVWFIDSDDVMHEGAYQFVIKQLEQFAVDIFVGDYVSWSSKRKTVKKSFIGVQKTVCKNKDNSFLKNIAENNSNFVWNKIYRRDVIKNVMFKEGMSFEDIYFMTEISFNCMNYIYCSYPLIDYRKREGSIVNSINNKYIDDYLGAFVHRIETWKKYNKKEDNEFLYYLYYKSFKRYVGLMKELSSREDKELMAYAYEKYNKLFISFNKKSKINISFIRRARMLYKYKWLKKEALNNSL